MLRWASLGLFCPKFHKIKDKLTGWRTQYTLRYQRLIRVVQSLSCVLLFATPWTAAHQAFLSTVSLGLLKLLSIESVMLPKHRIFCRLLLLLPSVFPNLLPKSQLFRSGGQNIGASASASVLPMNIQGWFSLGLTSLISLLSKGLSRVFSNHSLKASIL